MIEMMEGQVLYLPFPLFGYLQNVPHEIVPHLGSVQLFNLLVETRGNVFRDERKIGLIKYLHVIYACKKYVVLIQQIRINS
jgi:hypothetical protein